MGLTGSEQGGPRERFVVTEAERQVADLLPIEVEPDLARATVEAVPFWFHTFALNHDEGIYTPGAARDHRYRIPMLPADFTGMRVLDVGGPGTLLPGLNVVGNLRALGQRAIAPADDR